jgi:hypothetical protein
MTDSGLLLLLLAAGVAALYLLVLGDKKVFSGVAHAMMDKPNKLYSTTHKVAFIVFGDALPDNRIMVASVTNAQAAVIESQSPVCPVQVEVRQRPGARPRVTKVVLANKN